MSMTQRQPRNSRGFTLTEIAIVLGIIGLILGAVWAAASSVYLNMRVSTCSEKLLQMAQGIKSLHAMKSSFDAANIAFANMSQAGAFPPDTYLPATYLTSKNPFGGDYVFLAQASNSGYMIGFTGVPAAACSKLVLANFGSSNSQSVLGWAAGAAIAAYAAPTAAQQTSPTIASANTACNLASNNVYFWFKLGS